MAALTLDLCVRRRVDAGRKNPGRLGVTLLAGDGREYLLVGSLHSAHVTFGTGQGLVCRPRQGIRINLAVAA